MRVKWLQRRRNRNRVVDIRVTDRSMYCGSCYRPWPCAQARWEKRKGRPFLGGNVYTFHHRADEFVDFDPPTGIFF